MIRHLLPILFLVYLASCSPKLVPNSVTKFLSAEDEAVLELLTALRKKPNDQNLLAMLPSTYERAMESRADMKDYVLRDNPPGDRWVYWRKQLEASQSITDAVLAFPPSSMVIKTPVHFREQISEAKQLAAEEYYNVAMDLLRNNNRKDARLAIDFFNKATRELPNYRDINSQMRRAQEMATLYVVVNPVDYYQVGWNYWGFQNDWLQWQIINDLNQRALRYTRFMSEQEARGRRMEPERVVDMRFARLMVNNPYTERNTFEREKIITQPRQPGDTTNRPPSQVVARATITITKRLITGTADLETKIFDVPTGRNILYDHFPGRYEWVFESATFTGDQRALTDNDLRLINNRFERYPTRQEVGQQLIKDCYDNLIRRIEQGVNFDPW